MRDGGGPSPRAPSWVTPLLVLALATPSAARAQPAAAEPSGAQAVDALLLADDDGDTTALEALLPEGLDPARAALARLKVAGGRLDPRGAKDALAAYLATGDADPRRRTVAWAVATGVAFATGDYEGALAGAARWQAAIDPRDARARGDIDNLKSIALPLSFAPRQALESLAARPSPTTRDAAGLTRTTVLIGGRAVEAVLDTGANVSTVSASMAARLGLNMLDGEARVGSSTRRAVSIRVGVAERLEMAGAVFANVAFLVVDDDQLKLPLPGYRVDAIIGFPVFHPLGRVTFTADSVMAGGPATGAAQPRNLFFDGSSLFVALQVNGLPADLQLDSGATVSALSARFSGRYPQVLQGLPRKVTRTAGAGGVSQAETAIWSQVEMAVDGRQAVLPSVTVDVRPAPGAPVASDGLLGQDLLRSFDRYTVDFDAGRLELGQPAAKP